MIRRYLYSFLLGCLSLLSSVAFSQLRLPSIISDGIVLQRNMEIPVWGWAAPGETVRIDFMGETYTAVAGSDMKWKADLKPQNAGGPYEMKFTASNSLTLKDILVGDVWLCSGQSNMEFEMSKASEKYAKEIESSSNNQIRQFLVKRRISFNPYDDVETETGWQAVNPQTIMKFTAVGYFFAKNLYAKHKVPIGLINCSYGGTPAEAWVSEGVLQNYPHYLSKTLEYKDTALVNRITARDKQFAENWYRKLHEGDAGMHESWYLPEYNSSSWASMSVPGFWQDAGLKNIDAGIVWFRKEIEVPASLAGKNAVLRLGNIILKDITYFNGIETGKTTNKYIPRKYSLDGSIVKEGKNLIAVRIVNESGKGGFIKDKPYVLEIDGDFIELAGDWQYKSGVASEPLLREDVTRFQSQGSSMYFGMLSPLIGYGIKGVIWYQGESNTGRAKEYQSLFPALITSWREEWKQGDFPFLFVQLANINEAKAMPGESRLAELQEAQAMALSLPNTGMAVANDIGEWNDVHPLNKSDVGLRLSLAAQKLAYGNKKVVHSGPTFESMKIKGYKIILSFSNTGSGLMVKGGGELKHFAIAGESGGFMWANAVIKDDKVIVWSDTISNPVAVRYAWADNPGVANLYNKEGLPASCFRTDK